jgi:BirA family biotin operon repressor/biotin-[acetyl-CoA-carboxylase] ligase
MSPSIRNDRIEAAPLKAQDDALSQVMTLTDLLRDLDPAGCLPFENRLFASTCESTNDLGKRLGATASSSHDRHPESSKQPWLIIALEQSQGKGRMGKKWTSPAGGIYVSIVLPGYPTADLHSLPVLTGVGLCKGLDKLLAMPCKLKWPNDLLVENRKIGGVLIETVASGAAECHAVIGFGVNYQTAPEDSSYPATSILSESTERPSLPEAMRTLVLAVNEELRRSSDLKYAVDAAHQFSAHRIGDEMTCRTGDGTVSGRFDGFDSRGFLRLRANGTERIVSGAEIVSTRSKPPE